VHPRTPSCSPILGLDYVHLDRAPWGQVLNPSSEQACLLLGPYQSDDQQLAIGAGFDHLPYAGQTPQLIEETLLGHAIVRESVEHLTNAKGRLINQQPVAKQWTLLRSSIAGPPALTLPRLSSPNWPNCPLES
jgi:hypothetical protein